MEIQSKEDFALLVPYADYSSERTYVVSLSQRGIEELNAKHPNLLKKYKIENSINPVRAFLKKGKILLEDTDIDVLLFLGVYSLKNTQVKVPYFDRFFYAYKNGIIRFSDELEVALSKLTGKSLIGELLSCNGKIKFHNSLWSFKIIAERPINSLLFHERPRYTNRFLTLSLRFSKEENGEYLFENEDAKYLVNFYSSSPLLAQVLKKGRIINLATQRVYGDEVFKIKSPIILPKGMIFSEFEQVKAPRVYPNKFYNGAWAEYCFREQR